MLLNLLLTILIETPLLVLFMRREIPTLIIFSILMNMATLPVATWSVHELGINWFLIEFLVALTEALIIIWFWKMKPLRAGWMAFTANAVSAFFFPVIDWIQTGNFPF